MPERGLPYCASNNPFIPSSNDTESNSLSSSTSAIIIVCCTLILVVGIFWYVRKQRQTGSDGANKGDVIYPAGSVNRNPLIDENAAYAN